LSESGGTLSTPEDIVHWVSSYAGRIAGKADDWGEDSEGEREESAAAGEE